MNFKMVATVLAVASSMLVGCAGDESGTGGDESNMTETKPGAITATSTSTLASCAGRKPCVDAFVLKTAFASTLLVKGGFETGPNGTPLNEYIAKWLSATETRATIHIETNAAGAQTKVHISLGDHDADGTTESGCSLDLTLDGDHFVETQVGGQCAG